MFQLCLLQRDYEEEEEGIDQKVHIAIDNIGKLEEDTGEFINIDGMSKIDIKIF